MSKVEITSVSIDSDNRIRVSIQGSGFDDYALIYRTASGVRWDQENRCLLSEVPRKLTHSEWFELIRDAVRDEYGENIVISQNTVWEDVPLETQEAIEQVYSD